MVTLSFPYPQGHPGKEGPPGTKGNQVRSSTPPLIPWRGLYPDPGPPSPWDFLTSSRGSDSPLSRTPQPSPDSNVVTSISPTPRGPPW